VDRLIVVKFGGSVLNDGKSIRKVAEFIKRELEKGLKLVITVSAIKGETDKLLNYVRVAINGNDKKMIDDVIAMGEKTSARLFTNSLRSLGINAIVVDPESEYWPIITDENYGDANPILEKSKKITEEKLIPLINKGKVPVICGFIGRSENGNITTLGRGGSDTTAILLGRFLNADEVVLVKNVDGLFSADPNDISDAILIEEVTTEDLYILSTVGTKIIHSKALKYKPSDLKIRIISLKNGSLLGHGTVINGTPIGLEVISEKNSIVMITVLVDKKVDYGLLNNFSDIALKHRWDIKFITFHKKALMLYVSGDDSKGMIREIHNLLVKQGSGKAITAIKNLGRVIIRGHGLERISGVISKVTSPLAEKNINIFGLNTIASSIHIFLSSEDVDVAARIIKEVIEKEVV